MVTRAFHKTRIRPPRHGKVVDLIRLREVRAGCMVFQSPPGSARRQRDYLAVVQVNPCNLPLLSQGEQEAVFEGFRSWLNTLSYKEKGLSIHVRTRRYDITPYLERLLQAMENHISAHYRAMAEEHRRFVAHLASQHALLQREFFVRIPLSIHRNDPRYKQLSEEEAFDQVRADLGRKVREVMTGMSRAGLTTERLDSQDLVQYYLSCLHTKQAEEYALPRSLLYALDFPPKAQFPEPATPQPDLVAVAPEISTNEYETDLEADRLEGSRAQRRHITRRWVWHTGPQMTRFRKQQTKRSRREPSAQASHAPELMSLPELLAPASVEHTPYYTTVHHTVGDEYVRARAVIGYPAYAYPGWFSELLNLDEPDIDIVAYIDTIDPAAYVRALSRNLSGYRATQILEQRHGKTEDPYIAAARGEVEALREKLVQKTEHVHTFSLYLYSRAGDRQTLKTRDMKLASHLKALELQSVPLQFEHLPALLSLLDGRDLLHRERKLDTSTVVTAFPFVSSNLSTEPGTLVGLSPGGGLVIIDPTSPLLENGQEAVFARSGSGKSYHRKIDLSRSLLVGFEAVVLDPDREEYLPLCEQFGGSYIRLSPGNLHLNPFDLSAIANSERNALEEKIQSLLVLFDLLMAEKSVGVLSQSEKGYLAQLVTRAYAAHGIVLHPSSHTNLPPNMQELYDLIQADGDPFRLGDRLFRYLSSFPARTEVDLENPLTVFSLMALPEELQPVALYLVTEFVWAQARREHIPRPRLLVIDEAWMLMAFPEGGLFLAGISRRARKYNLHLKLATQNVEDFLNSEAGRTILLNASQKFVMKQDASTIDAVVQAFKLSEEERKFLLGADKGEGLYFCRASHVPLRVVASEVEHCLANTDPQTLRRQKQVHQLQAKAVHGPYHERGQL